MIDISCTSAFAATFFSPDLQILEYFLYLKCCQNVCEMILLFVEKEIFHLNEYDKNKRKWLNDLLFTVSNAYIPVQELHRK